jgi:transposase
VVPANVAYPTDSGLLAKAVNRIAATGRQIQALTARIDLIVTAANPGLRATPGVGPHVAAQLLITAGLNPDRLTSEASSAALCGAAPVPASSGKTRHYRLSLGGDPQANHAVHRIALNRMSHHQPTIAYVHRQTDRGRSKKEILRLLKRAICREIPGYSPNLARCRHGTTCDQRQAKGITLTTVAQHFGVWPATISTVERGLRRDDELPIRYRAWLAAA